jgi:hypothetical protein
MIIAAESIVDDSAAFTRPSSWEGGWSPKPLDGVRILTLVLIALDSPKVQALVQFQVGILVHALRVWRTHDCLRSSRARFDSSVGCFPKSLSQNDLFAEGVVR